MGSKTTPGASKVGFSSSRGKGLVTALRGIAPIGVFPVGASFLVGTTKGLILVGCDSNKEEPQKDEFLSS